MTSLLEIIKGQSIRIDNHDSGTGRAFEWGTGVHIHKKTNKKPYHGMELTIPLDRYGEIRFFKKNKDCTHIQLKLKAEIRKAFEKEKTRRDFVKRLSNALKSLVNINDLNVKVTYEKILRDSAESIIRLFGLTYKESDFWFTNNENFISMYQNEETKTKTFIQQNIRRQDIIIAENRDDLDIFNLDTSE